MKKKYWLTLGAVILVIAGLFFNSYYISGGSEDNVQTGTAIGLLAPDFTLTKLSGEEVSLSDFRGKKVFLNFWASWCPPCQAEMPYIQKLYTEHGDDVAILGVDIGEDKGTVAEFMLVNGYTFPVALDKKREVAAKYLVRGIPTTYIIDEDGIVTHRHVGPLYYEQMTELLELDQNNTP
ncbi:TlpA family protein disulfide reductase [Halothermothrix orenii]|uniref:Alkyl hydroperoxide reductase/ Thiol specific antioxidant/ Mal allergen n=1 Tax=Halothermothrix orenii (strain H 168 / OCM 544 / DSM 9562) TaxID=373903 RepID=B8CZ50_HALOH|nr:TlpA disulfide reductase family protein [Halothermothrix orenii]ACL70569.1 alkyl hydroperoxide reductase/ Thiol specific antioxidant/ Mal allergen [Halothermothrix orenii H 168]